MKNDKKRAGQSWSEWWGEPEGKDHEYATRGNRLLAGSLAAICFFGGALFLLVYFLWVIFTR